MNIEYAKEMVERVEADSFQKGNPIIILMNVASEKEIIKLVAQVGDEKARSIAASIKAIQASNNRYRKVTTNQERAIAQFLLSKYGTARAALAAAFGVTEQAMFGGEEEQVTEATPRVNVRFISDKHDDFVKVYNAAGEAVVGGCIVDRLELPTWQCWSEEDDCEEAFFIVIGDRTEQEIAAMIVESIMARPGYKRLFS